MQNIQEEIEDKVIDCINSGAGGRLVIFKPEKKGFENYLAIQGRGNYKEKEMYFQVNGLTRSFEESKFTKEFLQESFKTDKNSYLFFVYFDEVRQKMSDYIWLIPSPYFKDTAKVVKSPENKNILRFEAPLDFKIKNQYSEFLINVKQLGKTILDAVEKGGKFDFKEIAAGNPSENKKPVNLDGLKQFLCEARKNTYAVSAISADNPRLLESKQLDFQKSNYFYQDIYFLGNKKIIGQEIIYYEQKPIWGMSYMGKTIGISETNFLKESLLRLSNKCRLGQTCEYKKREFKYQDQGNGSLEDFSGEEQIFSEGPKDALSIYKLNYQGGLL